MAISEVVCEFVERRRGVDRVAFRAARADLAAPVAEKRRRWPLCDRDELLDPDRDSPAAGHCRGAVI
ncbi:MAG: hypothetical protein JO296_21310 [Pseudonocardiales bacterium]|nr:hypothetical protein [Pseudonocardiales bacterium]